MQHAFPPGFTEEELTALNALDELSADYGHASTEVKIVPNDRDELFAASIRWRRTDDPDATQTSVKKIPMTQQGRLWLRYEEILYSFMTSNSGIAMFEILNKTPSTLAWEWTRAKSFVKSARNYTPSVPATMPELVACLHDTFSRVVACESNPSNAILCLRHKQVEHEKLTEHIYRVLDVTGPMSFFVVNDADEATIEALFRLYAKTKEHVPSTIKTSRTTFIDALSREFPQLDIVETQPNTYLVRHAH
jgi:hypothetical protein